MRLIRFLILTVLIYWLVLLITAFFVIFGFEFAGCSLHNANANAKFKVRPLRELATLVK